MYKEELLSELKRITLENKAVAETFQKLSEEKLNQRPHENTWSILECLEHLNLYGKFYLPEIKNCIDNAPKSSQKEFKSGWIGNYFVNAIKPKEKLNKMKTASEMNPKGSLLTSSVLEDFIAQQNELLELLEKSQAVDLTKNKTKISISKWIKLRLGDTLRFVVYHNQRHIIQAQNIHKQF